MRNVDQQKHNCNSPANHGMSHKQEGRSSRPSRLRCDQPRKLNGVYGPNQPAEARFDPLAMRIEQHSVAFLPRRLHRRCGLGPCKYLSRPTCMSLRRFASSSVNLRANGRKRRFGSVIVSAEARDVRCASSGHSMPLIAFARTQYAGTFPVRQSKWPLIDALKKRPIE
jgi:hypothetical protein